MRIGYTRFPSLGARTPPSAPARTPDGAVRASAHLFARVAIWVLVLPALVSAAESRRNRDADGGRPTPPATAPAAASASPSPNGFDAFRIIAERNIFNPNRVGPTRAAPEVKAPRVDEIALVGTVEYAGQRVALFDSAEVAFRKSVREGETIGEFTVRRVGADGVELGRGDQTLTLQVTQQLRRPEGGDWTVAATPGAPRAEARSGDAPSAPAIPADASDVLKRLMRQREKQLK